MYDQIGTGEVTTCDIREVRLIPNIFAIFLFDNLLNRILTAKLIMEVACFSSPIAKLDWILIALILGFVE